MPRLTPRDAQWAPLKSWPKRAYGHIRNDTDWLLLLIVALALIAPWVMSLFFSGKHLENSIRYCGMALQIFGFLLTLWGIDSSLKQLGHKTILHQLKEYFSGFFSALLIRKHVVHAKGVISASSVGVARGRSKPGPDTPLETRIKILEEGFESLFNEVGQNQQQFKREVADVRKKLEGLGLKVDDQSKKMKQEFDQLAVGNSRLEIYGVLLFLFGVIYSTVSLEIAGCFR